MKKSLLLFAVTVLLTLLTHAQSVEGRWETIDDETGKARSIVDITINDGKLYGKVTQLFRAAGEDKDPVCEDCPGARKDKKVIGMTIITALEKDGNEWEADEAILDPEKGKIYDCKIWLDENNSDLLNVRGYIGFFYRTQVWKRAK